MIANELGIWRFEFLNYSPVCSLPGKCSMSNFTTTYYCIFGIWTFHTYCIQDDAEGHKHDTFFCFIKKKFYYYPLHKRVDIATVCMIFDGRYSNMWFGLYYFSSTHTATNK